MTTDPNRDKRYEHLRTLKLEGGLFTALLEAFGLSAGGQRQVREGGGVFPAAVTLPPSVYGDSLYVQCGWHHRLGGGGL